MFVFVTAVCVALVVSFLCSIFESVLLSLGHAHVESLARSGSRPGKILKGFKRNMDVPIAAILIANTIAHTIGASVAGASYEDVFDPDTLWIFTIVFTGAVLLFTEIVPKTVGVSYARGLAVPVAYGVRALTLFLRPLVFVSERLSRLLRGSKENPVTSLEEIRLLAMLGRDEGVVGARTAEMIEGAARLRELKARDVMVPRRFVSFLSAEQSIDENLAVLEKSGHSRFPFTPTASIDEVAGIVLAKDLLFRLRKQPEVPPAWEELMRKPLLVPESKSLHDLLRNFQEDRSHLAFVVDEYGGIEGIVTMEDVLEEVVTRPCASAWTGRRVRAGWRRRACGERGGATPTPRSGRPSRAPSSRWPCTWATTWRPGFPWPGSRISSRFGSVLE